MKKSYLFLLFGTLLLPSVIFGKDGADTLGLTETALYNSPFKASYLQKKAPALNLAPVTATAEKPKKTFYKSLRYSGWVRFYPFYRNMKSYYDITPANGLTLPVTLNADDGYQQPLMLIRLSAQPTSKVSFESELQFDNLLKRTTLVTDTAGRLANLYVIYSLQANIDTRIGHLRMIAGGGANWYRLSPSTLWGYQYRDDLFERYPWDPEGHDFSGRYYSAYAVGDIPRDQRFGRQAIQGFIMEGTNMPGGFEASVLYGKTTTAGGYQNYLLQTPQNVFAGRVAKKLGENMIGFNYFDQFGYTDNKVNYKRVAKGADSVYVEDNYLSQLITTVDGRFNFRRFSFFTEVGAGSYLSNTYNAGVKSGAKDGVENISRYKREWDPTLFFEIETKRNLTIIPLKISYYNIGAKVVNNASAVSNTSVEQAKPKPAANLDEERYFTTYYDGMVTDVGQLANNRQGLNISGSKKFDKLFAKFELGMAQELVNLAGDLRNGARALSVAGPAPDSITKVPFTNSITFEHKLNGLTRSRFAFYQRFMGPYNRIQSTFRRTFENIAITDTLINYKKSFSTFNLDLKYKTTFLGKDIIFTNYNNFSSVQDKWSPIPVWTDKAFLRYFYEEFMTFYAIHPKLTLVGFWGTERVKGNQRTELADANGDMIKNAKGRPVADPNGKPVDQIGYGYGLGLDYNFHSRASLHLRHRWFSQTDNNFVRDQFKGNEATLEFKVFF